MRGPVTTSHTSGAAVDTHIKRNYLSMSYECDHTNILFWMPLSKHWSNKKKNHLDRTTISPPFYRPRDRFSYSNSHSLIVPNNSISISAPLPTQFEILFAKWWLTMEWKSLFDDLLLKIIINLSRRNITGYHLSPLLILFFHLLIVTYIMSRL